MKRFAVFGTALVVGVVIAVAVMSVWEQYCEWAAEYGGQN